DLTLLRSNLQALADEARRQIRWADLMTAFSQHTPPTLRLQAVEAVRAVPPSPPGQPPGSTPDRGESTLRVDAITPLRPGSPTLLDIAKFMAGLMRDPVVNKRFQLGSWEIKPGGTPAAGAPQVLNVGILLSERAQ